MNNIVKAAVIGDPIHHSLSPKLHNFWMNKYGINGSYNAVLVKTEDLQEAVKSMVDEGYAGFNVTIPHKEKIFQLIKSQDSNLISAPLSQAAFLTKAVNTVIIKKNGALYGHNSDCDGFLDNLKNSYPNINFGEKNAFIIGAGGAARAIIHSLITDAKVKNIFVTNRSKEKFDLILSDFKQEKNYLNANLEFLDHKTFEQNLSSCDLLINSTSLGMLGQPPLQLDLKNLQKSAIVYDIVYKPLLTNLLKTAQSQGNKIVTGIGMLAFQGAVGFKEWFGHEAMVDDKLLEFLTEESRNN